MVKRFCFYGLVLKGIMVTLLGVGILYGFGFGFVEGTNPTSGHKILQVRKKINSLKSHAIRSIQSEDGDIIDCIDIYKQPAFDHPALKTHIIQMAPSYDPNKEETTINTSKKKKGSSMSTLPAQLWQKNGSCPEGTIPIRRIQEKEMLKSNSVEDYGRKQPSFPHHVTDINKGKSYFKMQNRSVAILLTYGYSYSGIKGDIKVWNPRVETDDEYSTSQISLKSGPYYDFENVEAGWAVNPSVYGDRQTRLFVYWTVDASKTTGCFDLTCPGFVQTSSEIALGAAIYPLSVPFGLPYQITLYIFKDPATGNWWVQYGEKINLGYWPSKLFGLLKGNAEAGEWGGEVYSTKLGQPPHTKTEMGTGHFADPIFDTSGYMKRMRIRENSLILKFPEWVSTYMDEYTCYDVYYVGDYIEDPEFYYGGPGRNPMCP